MSRSPKPDSIVWAWKMFCFLFCNITEAQNLFFKVKHFGDEKHLFMEWLKTIWEESSTKTPSSPSFPLINEPHDEQGQRGSNSPTHGEGEKMRKKKCDLQMLEQFLTQSDTTKGSAREAFYEKQNLTRSQPPWTLRKYKLMSCKKCYKITKFVDWLIDRLIVKSCESDVQTLLWYKNVFIIDSVSNLWD